MAKPERKSVGEFTNIDDAFHPPQLGENLPRRLQQKDKRDLVTSVPDPHDPTRRIKVVFSADEDDERTFDPVRDILRRELKKKLIDNAAYDAGRDAEFYFSRLARTGGGGQWLEGDRVDAATAHEDAIAYAVDDQKKIRAYLHHVRITVGKRDMTILWCVLGQRMPYWAVAERLQEEKPGDRDVRHVARCFREALKALAQA